MPGNGHAKLWALALVLITALVAAVGTLLQREVSGLERRLDRVTDYVLEHTPAPNRPANGPATQSQ